MTYSPLTDQRMPPTGTYQGGKKWSARPARMRINGLNVHHWAATNMSGLQRLVRSNAPASANYLILNDGTLVGSVAEEYRAWTTSAYANDDDKITVEIQNESAGPSWRISDKAMATLTRLYADLARRYGFAPTRANIRGHQEYGVATACPGPYLLARLDDVARGAAALLGGKTPTIPNQEDDMSQAAERQIDELHQKLLRKFTDADKAIDIVDGVRRDLVVTRRNEDRLKELVTANRAQSAAIEAMATSVGVDPKVITATVQKSVDKALADLKITLSTESE